MSDNQLAQCAGDGYDHIKAQILQAQEGALQASEEDDEAKEGKYSKYKTYLERCLKVIKIDETAHGLSSILSEDLQKYFQNIPEIHHVSAADYMKWIAKEKILFRDQPALTPEDTGIPALRKFLMSLPADRNLTCYTIHLQTTVPAMIEQIQRVVTPLDRDEGFRAIAEACELVNVQFMKEITSQAKSTIQNLSKQCLSLARQDSGQYKKTMDRQIRKDWISLKGAAFQSVVKSKGLIPKGRSRAQALAEGCNWNMEIAKVLKPGFEDYHIAHTELMGVWKDLVLKIFDGHYQTVRRTINNSAANLNTIEKSKWRWGKLMLFWRSKLQGLMQQLVAEESQFFSHTVSTVDRENKLIALVTDDLYEQVFLATPDLKKSSPGKPKQYVTPRIKFQKDLMEELFLEKDHIVDRVLSLYNKKLNNCLTKLVEKGLGAINSLFNNYIVWLKEHAPIDYEIIQRGLDIRDDLKQLLPELEKMTKQMCSLLPPKAVKKEDDTELSTFEDIGDPNAPPRSLQVEFEKFLKRKRPAPSAAGPTSKVKREKH